MYITIKKQKQGELIVNQANWIGFCDNWNLLVPEMKFLVHKVQAKRSLQTSFLALNCHAASAGCREEGRSTYVATVRLKDPPENQNPPRLAWTLATWHREKLLPNVRKLHAQQCFHTNNHLPFLSCFRVLPQPGHFSDSARVHRAASRRRLPAPSGISAPGVC